MSLHKQFGLTDEEFAQLESKLGRSANLEEIAVTGALWSEHCSYKSSRVHLKRFHTEEPWVVQGPGENAGVVQIEGPWCVAFKMESHNHPSYIEPYQGAATGVGGILRDVFCMGARPVANINCLRYGEGNDKLIRNTVKGIGDYGNSVGVPTVSGDTSFHFGYSKNILVNAFTAGIIHKDKIFKGVLSEETGAEATQFLKAPGETLTEEDKKILFPDGENLLIYFGSATGRDGVHGATMSSSEFSHGSETLKPTVQVGDPFAEKILMEATLKLIDMGLCVGLQDMGAAGLTSSSVEMAGRSGCGVAIDLTLVPTRAAAMQPWELLLSESQERMLAAVVPAKLDKVREVLETFNLAFAVIGKVNHTGKFTCTFYDELYVNMPVGILVEDTPKYQWPLEDRDVYLKNKLTIENKAKTSPDTLHTIGLQYQDEKLFKRVLEGETLEGFLKVGGKEKLLDSASFASREPLYLQYDSTVQGNTVAAVGAMQEAAAGVVRLPRETGLSKMGVCVAGGCEERWVDLNPFTGSAQTVLKVARKIVAVGGTPLAMTDCLNFGSPKNPSVMRQFSDSVDGINLIAKEFHIPIVSGNVSLNNQTDGHPIPPTPMIGMVGKVADVSQIPLSSVDSFSTDIDIYHVASLNPATSLLAGEAAWLLGGKNAEAPELELEKEKLLWNFVRSLIESVKPKVCVPVGQGGIFVSALQLSSQKEFVWTNELLCEPVKNLLAEGNLGFLVGIPTGETLKQQSDHTIRLLGTFKNETHKKNPSFLDRYF